MLQDLSGKARVASKDRSTTTVQRLSAAPLPHGHSHEGE